ncbi:SMP-30/gluconolactonase/LRE family protein [Cytophagaceae bacterium DM2B3-1]|uniref:SMP-30/gluconolactonase/LRE family protein n=1 Tax=Xanthocytophaga flava TaxID=3048013 RepID=A0ABT7CGT8_9BACT|nr:SMP-30/gluconolactonase/LRE family protein [Xanthocytophaga flavus]MDJ1469007.1 SMP-30/gluconolactonase/LRE family protein [Xanthocytophaga flavus]MDJ1492185.1 SMP-30/gluconolactonase/LRE family protein [Xanthocytophaga flavus]
MIKILRNTILFYLSFLAISPTALAQDYSFKKHIGQIILSYCSDVVVDKEGFMYVISNNDYFAKIDSNNQIVFFIPMSGGIGYLALDKEENIWVCNEGSTIIQKYDTNGKLLQSLQLKGSNANPYFKGMEIDQQNNIWLVDLSTTHILKFDATGKLLLEFGTAGSGDGQFNTPEGITIDTQGNIWIVDAGNNCIQKFDKDGKFLLKVGTEGSANGQFNRPRDIEADDKGNVWVAEQSNSRIQKFDSSGNFLLKVGPTIANGRTINNAWGLTIDRSDNVWFIDYSGFGIRKFDSNGKYLGEYGGPGNADGKFSNPSGLHIDKQGNIWVMDSENSQIQKFDKNGRFLTKIGSKGTGNGQLFRAAGLTTDEEGNIWVADQTNQRVQKFNKSGNVLLTFGSLGSADGQFYQPLDITVDVQGNVWVLDPGNQRVQKFDKNGNFLFKFGSYGPEDGQLGFSGDIAMDTQGNLWITDTYFHRVQKFDQNGKLLKKIQFKPNGDNVFQAPDKLAIDSKGNIWVHDFGDRIQTFDTTGKILSTRYLSIASLAFMEFDRSGDLYLADNSSGVWVYSKHEIQTLITGRVYSDENQNCAFDSSDKPLDQIVMVAQPGEYYGVTDAEGNYEIAVDTGTYTVSQVLGVEKNSILQVTCPSDNVSDPITLKTTGSTISNINFANKITLLPHLTSNVSSNRRRRCMTNTTIVNYANTGYGDAKNVKVYVKMPHYVIFKSADKPYTIDKDSNYVFTIDTLNALHSGVITITDSVACINSVRGLTQCTKVWITPANDYTLPDNSQWDNSDIVLTGKCIENGRVQMVIKNIGQAMADSAEFRILLNAQLAFRRNYKLEKGDSLMLKIPVNGKTVRLEADQRPDHPRKSQTNLTIEGCVASTSDVVSKGYVDLLPQDDAEPEVAIQCLEIIDSFDPNDKLVSPAGTPTDHYIPTSTELKYTIRFQNTGTDHAYTVTVIDTLSENLDIATLQMGAVTHTYSLKVSGKGKPILIWTFNNINLPDSTRDQAGSNGFIQFSIKPKASLPEKSLIENFADIIFDYNDPVRTNTTTNVLYDVPKVINPANQLDESIIDDKVMATEPNALRGKLALYPNPTQNRAWIQASDVSITIQEIVVYNLLGEKQIVTLYQTQPQTLEINMQSKPKGIYLVHIHTNKGTSIKRVVVQ